MTLLILGGSVNCSPSPSPIPPVPRGGSGALWCGEGPGVGLGAVGCCRPAHPCGQTWGLGVPVPRGQPSPLPTGALRGLPWQRWLLRGRGSPGGDARGNPGSELSSPSPIRNALACPRSRPSRSVLPPGFRAGGLVGHRSPSALISPGRGGCSPGWGVPAVGQRCAWARQCRGGAVRAKGPRLPGQSCGRRRGVGELPELHASLEQR